MTTTSDLSTEELISADEQQSALEKMRAEGAARQREPICPPWCDGHGGEYQVGDGVERNHDSAGGKVSISCVETMAGGERSFSDPAVVVYDVDEVTMTPQQVSQVGSELFRAVRTIYDNQVTEVPIQRTEPPKPGPEDTGLLPVVVRRARRPQQRRDVDGGGDRPPADPGPLGALVQGDAHDHQPRQRRQRVGPGRRRGVPRVRSAAIAAGVVGRRHGAQH